MKIFWTLAILIILVGGGWFLFKGMPAAAPTTAENTAANTGATPPGAIPHDNIYLSNTDPNKGTYMTDFAGKTLYTFDNDTPGVSNCTGACATAWPPYESGAAAEKQLPTDISLITRADGSQQFAWKNKPLYYFAKDTAPGQTLGDGVGGTWHIVGL